MTFNEFLSQSDKQILAELSPMFDNMMQGSTERNHVKHTEHFTQRLKDIVTKENLLQQCESYQAKNGFFTEREPVAVFRRKESIAIIFKQAWSKRPGEEFVAQAVFVATEEDGQLVWLMDHAMVF